MPSRSAARPTSAPSPTDSAAAISRSRCELSRQSLDAPHEALLDLTREGLRVREREAAGELGRREPSGQLQQRQWVAAGLADDAVPHPLVDPAEVRRVQERAGILVRQPADHLVRQPVQLRHSARLAHGEDQRHRFGQQAARHEREDLRRGLIQPLRVVDQADERALLGNVREQAEHGEPDQKVIGRLAGCEPERGGERIAVRTRAGT